MSGWMSSVPGAIDGLLKLLRDMPFLEGVTVLDGPTVTADPIAEAITVGYEDPGTSAVVEGASEPEGLTRDRDREIYTVMCAVEVLLGSSTDLPAARCRAYELFGFVGQVLADNHTLNRAVMMAHLGAHTLSQDQLQQGALARIVFGVDCDAFSRR